MRVITGRYRAKVIKAPEEIKTRPTLQRAKETMFNMLPHNLNNGKCLDVFAGSGQLGIEALSRGLNYCVFNEPNNNSVEFLKSNLKTIPKDEFKIESLDYKDLINKYQEEKFDLILIDPPYPIAQESIDFLLNFIDKNNMLNNGGHITGEIPVGSKITNEYNSLHLRKYKNFSKLTTI